MIETLLIKPVFNLLVAIYALLPGHNFGLALVIFTVVVRFAMWPLVKKQLAYSKAMRELQPELKRIKKEAKGDRQKESVMVMELYKERQINPMSSMGILLIQLPIIFILYAVVRRIVHDPHVLVSGSYDFIKNLGWMKQLAGDITKFDNTLFGWVDLSKTASGKGSGIYWPAMGIVLASALAQYYQTKQLSPADKNARKLRHILKDAGEGKQADNAEINAAMGRNMRFFVPVMIFLVTLNIPATLALYLLTGSLVALAQQAYLLKQDVTKLEASVDTTPVEAEVVSRPNSTPNKKTKKSKSASKRRR